MARPKRIGKNSARDRSARRLLVRRLLGPRFRLAKHSRITKLSTPADDLARGLGRRRPPCDLERSRVAGGLQVMDNASAASAGCGDAGRLLPMCGPSRAGGLVHRQLSIRAARFASASAPKHAPQRSPSRRTAGIFTFSTSFGHTVVSPADASLPAGNPRCSNRRRGAPP